MGVLIYITFKKTASYAGYPKKGRFERLIVLYPI